MVKITDYVYAVRIERLSPISTGHNDLQNLMWAVADKDLKHVEGNEHLARIATFLMQYSDKNDLHQANVMMRGHQLVITDPLAS